MAGRDWEYSLRVCGPGGEEKLALVGAASFLEAFAGGLPGEDVLAHCRNQHSVQKYAALLVGADTYACIAEVKDAPVGYAVLCPPDMPVPVTPDDIELKRIYLLHRFQGSGIGAALMDWSVQDGAVAGQAASAAGCERRE